MRITRDIIRKDIMWRDDDRAFDEICEITNSFKHMLLDADAKKGDLVAIGIISVNIEHLSAIIACAELGLRVIILDAPATKISLPYTKLAIHGPADFYIIDKNSEGAYGGLHLEMLLRYGGRRLSTDFLNLYLDSEDIIPGWDISEDDPFVVSSTSGSTKRSRKIEFTHKETYEISKRAIDIFKWDEESGAVHSRNLHHASALFTHSLPSLMTCKYHFERPIPDKLSFETLNSSGMNRVMRDGRYTHIMIPNEQTLEWFFANTRRPFAKTIIINMSGFTLTKKYTNWAKKYNVEFISHYGSIDTAIPLLVNHVTPQTSPDEIGHGYLGKAPDNYYSITLNNGQPILMCRLWSEPRKMDDVLRFEPETQKFYHVGRAENESYQFYLDEAERLNIDLDLFFQDTKINMEQLRGHIHEVKKSEKK